jgi:hypothetical protein
MVTRVCGETVTERQCEKACLCRRFINPYDPAAHRFHLLERRSPRERSERRADRSTFQVVLLERKPLLERPRRLGLTGQQISPAAEAGNAG